MRHTGARARHTRGWQQTPALLQVVAGQQPLDRHLEERRVAQPVVPVGERQPLRFGHHRDRLRRVEADPLEHRDVEQTECLGDRHAAGAGHRVRDQLVLGVLEDERLAPFRRVAVEVRVRDEPTVRLHVGDDQVGHPAAVEAVTPVPGDRLERGGEIGLRQHVPHAGAAALEPERLDGGRELPQSLIPLQTPRQGVGHRKSVAGQRDGRRQDVGTTERAVSVDELQHPIDTARHAHPRVRVRAQPGHHLAVGVDEHVLGGRRRRRFAKVQREGLAIRRQPHHEAATADVPGRGVGHRQRELHRGCRIERVAAGLQDRDTDIGRERLR